jgi:hypothetical protein
MKRALVTVLTLCALSKVAGAQSDWSNEFHTTYHGPAVDTRVHIAMFKMADKAKCSALSLAHQSPGDHKDAVAPADQLEFDTQYPLGGDYDVDVPPLCIVMIREPGGRIKIMHPAGWRVSANHYANTGASNNLSFNVVGAGGAAPTQSSWVIIGSDAPPPAMGPLPALAAPIELKPGAGAATVPLSIGSFGYFLLTPPGSLGMIRGDQFALTNPSPARFRVEIGQAPLSRVRVNFDSVQGSHVEVEWDPAVPSALTRLVTLPPDTWRVSFFGEPLTLGQLDSSGNQRVVAPVFPAPALDSSPSSTLIARVATSYSTLSGPESGTMPSIAISIFQDTPPSMSLARKTLTSPASGVSGRSLQDAVPQPFVDFLTILSQIAFERAKAAAFQILTSRIVQFVCVDLKVPDDGPGQLMNGSNRTTGTSSILLPKTCDVVQHLRLQDIATSAKALMNALFGDLARYAVIVVGQQVQKALTRDPTLSRWAQVLSPVFTQLEGFVVDLAAGRTTLTGNEAHLLLVNLAKEDWSQIIVNGADSPAVQAMACGAELAFAAIAHCQAAGGCDARAIADMVENPSSYFSDPKCFVTDATSSADTKIAALTKQWPDLAQFIKRGLDVFFPPKNATAHDTVLGAVNLAFDIVERILTFEVNLPGSGSAALADLQDPNWSAAATTALASAKDSSKTEDERATALTTLSQELKKMQAQPGAPPPNAANLARAIVIADWAGSIVAKTSKVSDNLVAYGKDRDYLNKDAQAAATAIQSFDLGLVTTKPDDDSLSLKPVQDAISTVLKDCANKTTCIATTPTDAQSAIAGVAPIFGAKPVSSTANAILEVVKDVHTLVNGVIDRDAQAVLLAAASLVQKIISWQSPTLSSCDQIADASARDSCRSTSTALAKITALVGAVTAYAATYTTDAHGDPKLIQAQQDARKKAVESLIDAATNRTNRDGDWVVSIGANVGLSIGWQWLAATNYQVERQLYPQLELPVGVAVQLLPDRRLNGCCWLKKHSGFHAQLSVLDIAQFISYRQDGSVSPITWSNFVMVGLQAGWIIGTPSTPFIIGVEGRWAPTLFTQTVLQTQGTGVMTTQMPVQEGGAWRLGLFVSYYVPFFDFN